MLDIVQICVLFGWSLDELEDVQPEPRYGVREWVKAIKSKNFYSYVRMSVGATTHYQVERMFGKKPGGSETGKWIDTKKWRDYARGYHLPSARTVNNAEHVAKQSFKQELTLVLWNVLDVSLPIGNRTRHLIHSLPSEDRGLARTCDKLLHAKGEGTAAISQVCATLTAKPSFERLAIITLFLRKSSEIGDQERCCIFSVAVVKMLLLLGLELTKRRIAVDLYWFYSEHIFDLIPQVIFDNEMTLLKGAQLLHLLAFVPNTNDATSAVEENERVKRMNRFLDGEHGSAFLHALLPFFQPHIHKSYHIDDNEELLLDSPDLFDEDCYVDLPRDSWELLGEMFRSNYIPRILHPGFIDPDLNFKVFSLKVQAFRAKVSQSPIDTVPWLGLKY